MDVTCLWILLKIQFVCLCFTSDQHRGHLETTLPLTVPCEGREAGKYTVPTGNRTRGHCLAVHYATAAPRKLHYSMCNMVMYGETRLTL